ncbi:MAG: hypothetical protein KF680_04620 [Cryobacterium sp.]|nr:hypothetical protein [Cryobacterium sp.]
MIDLPPAKPRPLATGGQWAASLLALGIVGSAIVGLQLWRDLAWTDHLDVRARYDVALSDASKWSTALESNLQNGDNLLRVSGLVAESATGYAEDSAIESLTASESAFSSVVTSAEATANWVAPQHESLDERALLWEVLGESSALRDATATLAADSERLHKATATLIGEGDEFEAAIVTLINTVGAVGESQLPRYPSATNESYRDLKTAVDSAISHRAVDSRSTWIVERVVETTDAFAASHAEKEAAKAGPLAARRTEIEDFARSIAGGVRIDFTWQDIVIGHGQGRSAAGTATWDTADSGYSSVTLTNSIARYWTEWAGYRSLVAHEIGHSITSKCYEAFKDGPFGNDNERWATAWAIGMGYTVAAANGSDLYGAPTAEQINATMSCR